MSNEHLETYLNDHLAGSVAALELLEHLESAYKNTNLRKFVAELREEITADQKTLEDLMTRLNVEKSTTRKATAWIAGKLGELKLRVDDPSAGVFRLFEALEALSLGIAGKRSLWLALKAAAEESPALKLVDYDRLITRAEEQHSKVESQRLPTARLALIPEPQKMAQSPDN